VLLQAGRAERVPVPRRDAARLHPPAHPHVRVWPPVVGVCVCGGGGVSSPAGKEHHGWARIWAVGGQHELQAHLRRGQNRPLRWPKSVIGAGKASLHRVITQLGAPTATFCAVFIGASAPLRRWGPERRIRTRARSHCRFVLPLIHFIPGSLRGSVPLLLKRQCDRNLIRTRTGQVCEPISPSHGP
jgi:hypothetical protein